MRRTNFLLALVLVTALAGLLAMNAQAQAPASFLTVTAITAAQAQSQPSASQPSSSQTSSSQSSSSQPSGVQVDIKHESRSDWPVSPLWLAIGGVALLALIAIIVAGGRKDQTTIVK